MKPCATLSFSMPRDLDRLDDILAASDDIIDLELVWEVARTLVPELRAQISAIRSIYPEEQ